LIFNPHFYQINKKQMNKCKRKVTNISKIGLIWFGCSILSTLIAMIGFYSTYWIVGNLELSEQISFGCWRVCNYREFDEITNNYIIRKQCGRYIFLSMPSVYWQITTVLIGVGILVNVCILIFLIPFTFVDNILSKNSALLCGLGQVLTGVIIFIGCSIYPLGFDNSEIFDACGQSEPYITGRCFIGWALYCEYGASILLLICGLFSIKSVKETEVEYQGSNEPLTAKDSSLNNTLSQSKPSPRNESASYSVTGSKNSFRIKMNRQRDRTRFINV
uniref:Lipoma HMGIC fusion partner-like protein n=1 Tax=Rhabditophanes sp. KR3021 TaxID=114890 RepID=A0AC35UB47_9BILA